MTDFEKEDTLQYFTDARVRTAKVAQAVLKIVPREHIGKISDGYHTFDELYEHRITLYIQLCKQLGWEGLVWRSKFHSDGTSCEGWFILGIGFNAGEQITYHLPISRWDDCWFAVKRDKAPEYDGHTPSDVLERLKRL